LYIIYLDFIWTQLLPVTKTWGYNIPIIPLIPPLMHLDVLQITTTEAPLPSYRIKFPQRGHLTTAFRLCSFSL